MNAWQQSSNAFLYETRLSFGMSRPTSFVALTGLVDSYAYRKPRVYDARARSERDEQRARLVR